ncbi:MAG TPA: hypothetical protein VMW22_01160 [Candidatus Desulfaltia sp.]|nr:hypothetical protein [Candidatus Desulfaltia sp.]
MLGLLLIPLMALIGVLFLLSAVFIGVSFTLGLAVALITIPLKVVLWVIRVIFRF